MNNPVAVAEEIVQLLNGTSLSEADKMGALEVAATIILTASALETMDLEGAVQ